ncbi:hypothetical protein DAPPUDRAFT_303017 [Daphnia pulex]|uniref:Uncharacterized protein n=1 Tax=Daphnia pulex TaxID=6669 RepID=E9FTI4_DAPPU|nr:hypothetical protein DAPPUDRAFT_303017 [Daphnia pulex]|eukprot:EFX89632.1 hypothetical protein DAPPUDRAFT_303017 [Daphnia pulex]
MKTQKTTDQIFNAATQNITGRAISYGMDENANTKNVEVRNPDATAQLQQHSNFWITLQPHATSMVQSVFVTPFTIWLQQGNHQRLFHLLKKRKLFSINTTVYTCILIITIEYKE